MTEPYIRTDLTDLPDERGYFGEFGGRFVPETIIPALDELESAYACCDCRSIFSPRACLFAAHLHWTANAGQLCAALERKARRRANLS